MAKERRIFNEDLEEQYKFFLSLHYGDRRKLAESLTKEIARYKTCKIQEHEKVVSRIKSYSAILQYCNAKL